MCSNVWSSLSSCYPHWSRSCSGCTEADLIVSADLLKSFKLSLKVSIEVEAELSSGVSDVLMLEGSCD